LEVPASNLRGKSAQVISSKATLLIISPPPKKEGGAFGGVEDLYREVILDHFKSPKNKGKCDPSNAQAEGLNPLCGDQIEITAFIDGDRVNEVKFDGHGCAISQSAASMMTQIIKGKTRKEINELAITYKNIFGIQDKNGAPSPFTSEDLGDAVALEGVKKYPVRIKCALLSWNTLLECLNK